MERLLQPLYRIVSADRRRSCPVAGSQCFATKSAAISERSRPAASPLGYSAIRAYCKNTVVRVSHRQKLRSYLRSSRVRPEDGAELARGISPRAAHRSGLDTLASSGSCHQPKAAAFRRELELLLSPVCSLPTSVTCPLCSTGITPLHHYYGAVRPGRRISTFRPRGWAACAFSLRIADQVLKFHARAQMRITPPIHRTPYGQ